MSLRRMRVVMIISIRRLVCDFYFRLFHSVKTKDSILSRFAAVLGGGFCASLPYMREVRPEEQESRVWMGC